MKLDKLPAELIEQYFYKYSSNVTKKANGVLNGRCPTCHEGDSWNTKKRLYFIPEKYTITCHNCAKNWYPAQWIVMVSGVSYKDIATESLEYDIYYGEDFDTPKKTNSQILPYDSINLFDPIQVKYYEDNVVVQDALAIIKKRRLDTAVNSVPLYVSLKDFIHKNRICIPFYDTNNKISFFQTRAIYSEDAEIAKYLSKSGSDKTVFGLNKISYDLDYLFITEGPIDSMFIQNGISMAGLQISEKQMTLLNPYFLYKKIWVLDNQLDNKEVVDKYHSLINKGETVMIWPKSCKTFKDFNEMCVHYKLDKISTEFVIKNSFEGKAATLKLATL